MNDRLTTTPGSDMSAPGRAHLLAELRRVFADAHLRHRNTLRERATSAFGCTKDRIPNDRALTDLIPSFSLTVDGRAFYRTEAQAAAALLLAEYLADADVLTILKGD